MRVEAGITLKEKISSVLVDQFTTVANKVHEEQMELSRQGKDYESKLVANKLKSIHRIISNLKMAPFKNNVMSECKEAFYRAKFEDILDKNK